ncbi:MAG: hypothetical protein LBE76_01030 [Nitrososphaerota archaeon]|jgi:hypothetical protein|nr:hypothetical protein [Nitrososphaerota archaeon]
MAIEQFTVQSSPPAIIDNLIVGLIVIGAVLLVINLLMYSRLKDSSSVDGERRGSLGKYALAILGIGLILGGCFFYGVSGFMSSPAVVTVGDGYISVETGMAGVNSNKNVTSEEIATAFVGQVGSGDFTLSKTSGTNFGDTNIGRYTLGNGATAYVASTNSTNLIIELKNGEYIIAGNQDTQAIANSFSQNVHSFAP